MKKYNKLIINNLKCSFRNNIFIYLLFVVLILLSCIYLKNGVMHGKSVGAGDYYFNIIKGVEKIDSNNKLKEIPFIYLGFAIFISYITGQILENECNKIFIIYAGTRKKWILSKITAIFINIVFMYMTTAIICFMSGKRKITFNSELFEKYFGTDYFIMNDLILKFKEEYCDLDPGVLLVFLKNLINMSIIVSELQPPQVDTKPLCYVMNIIREYEIDDGLLNKLQRVLDLIEQYNQTEMGN